MQHLNTKFKKGATSVYVVVIATLLFSVITVSFIRIIINETSKTTSDELAQSAYDSALAGVEDAKVALKRYYECQATENPDPSQNCETINTNVQSGFADANGDNKECDSIAKALGRYEGQASAGGEVLIKETKQHTTGSSSSDNENIAQAYTCVQVNNTLDDYRGVLEPGTVRVVPLKTEHPEEITGLKISWLIDDDIPFATLNYASKDKFKSLSDGTPTPPTVSAQVIQTDATFSINEFDKTIDGKTNRGTVILVPTNSGGSNHIAQGVVALSNSHDYADRNPNVGQKINCGVDVDSPPEFACSATVELPDPIAHSGGSATRNKNTFYLVLSVPYGQPTAHFSIQLCKDKEPGGTRGDCAGESDNTAKFIDAQIAVDATGRANDMYSRVEARVEFGDPYFPYPEFAIQATSSDEDSIKKNFYVTQNCFITKPDGQVEPCDNTGDAPES